MNLYIEELSNINQFFFGGSFGAIFSSFYSLVYYRIPRNESINGRSHCICGKIIPYYENIPIFGYIFLKGKSSCCKTTIPKNLFIAEIITFVIAGLILSVYSIFYLFCFLLIYGIIVSVLSFFKKKSKG
jgi:leader peptidase (prepilin peptidase)/N-methyltransferase